MKDLSQQEQKRKLGGGNLFIQHEKQQSLLSNLNKSQIPFIPFSQERDGIGKIASKSQTQHSKKNKKYHFDKRKTVFDVLKTYISQQKKSIDLEQYEAEDKETFIYWNSKDQDKKEFMINKFQNKQSQIRKTQSSRIQSACFKSQERKNLFPIPDYPSTQYEPNKIQKNIKKIKLQSSRPEQKIQYNHKPFTDTLDISKAFSNAQFNIKKCDYTINNQLERSETKQQWWNKMDFSGKQKKNGHQYQDKIEIILGQTIAKQRIQKINSKNNINPRIEIPKPSTHPIYTSNQLNFKYKKIKNNYSIK